MSESKPNATVSRSDGGVKGPNIFERAKEDIEAVVHTVKIHHHHHHHKETHGMRQDIDENTPLGDVKAPNVFERAKEEIEALVEAIHQRKESKTHDKRDQLTKAELHHEKSETEVKVPNLIERTKEEFQAIFHKEKSPPPHHHHHKETHGMSNDIDASTPLNEVKAPNVFERAKEEGEAILERIHPNKKESSDYVSSQEEDEGFRHCLGMGLEKVCCPWSVKRD
ncbi:hypothetical protein SLA2020_506110 [Shorea laevis]